MTHANVTESSRRRGVTAREAVRMYLSGFHGTTLTNARRIMREGRFDRSEGDANWLGPGVYFYTNIVDACAWRDAEVVLHSIIHLEDDQLYDFDTDSGRRTFNYLSMIVEDENDKLGLKKSAYQRQRNQDTISRIVHYALPNVEAFTASFPVGDKKPQAIFDPRPLRKEFCLIDYPREEKRSNPHIRTIRALSVAQIRGIEDNPSISPI